ncbi:MAG: hypothetical protein K6G80_07270 [Treponema sp.]|nr:hypothetical protein [Treponema sp.]
MKKIALIILVYILLSFGICLGIANLTGNVPPLLAGGQTPYIFFRSVLLFFKLLPALMCSAFLVAASICFGHSKEKALFRYSPVQFANYRNVMIASLCMVFLLMLAKEVGIPAVQARQASAEMAPRLLSEYILSSEHYYAQGNDALAHEYAKSALKIDPANKIAAAMIENTEKNLRQIKPMVGLPGKETDEAAYASREVQNETVTSLIEKSKAAAKEDNWFTAHYYAQLAVSIGTTQDVNYNDARHLAADAWNHLRNPRMEQKNEVWDFYLAKRTAYFALMQGDSIEAYYQFLELSKKMSQTLKDPDVEYFLQIALGRIEADYFFIDETLAVERYESAQNIYFTIPHAQGGRDVVFIRGMTRVKNTGGLLTFLRGFTMYTYGADGRLIRSIFTPYAKMVAEPVAACSRELVKAFDLRDSYVLVPALQLKSIEREFRGTANEPEYVWADFVAESDRTPYNYLVLSMPFSEFLTACDISLGPDRMNLPSLMKVCQTVDDFGFSSEIFTTALVRRLLYPLLLLILFVFCASFAWNYRLSQDQLFKFKWIFVLPFASFLLYLILEALLFMVSIVCYALVAVSGELALVIAVCVCLALLFGFSAVFLARTSN